MIVIQASTLNQILGVMKIILEKNCSPILNQDYPLEITISRAQMIENCEELIVQTFGSDIILGKICFWDNIIKEYLDISYDAPKRILTIESRQYFISDLDSPRPLIVINI